jgi:hypothetical protein
VNKSTGLARELAQTYNKQILMYYKLASILLNGTEQKNDTSTEIFVAQTDSAKEALAGKVFMQLELNLKKSDALKLIEFIINYFTENYYNNERLLLREKMQSLKIEHIFEAALAKSNEALADFLEEEKIKFTPHNINAVIGVVHKDGIHFSTCGKVKALLLYKEKDKTPDGAKADGDGKASYKAMNIISKSEANSHSAQSNNKIFASVINGQIPKHAYLVFSNEALSEYISDQQLTSVVTKLPPVSAAEQIKKTWKN